MLMLATARHLGQQLLTVVRTAWQTLTAGRACREPTMLVGNPYFVGTTPQPPASQAQSQSPEAVPQTSLEQKIGNVNQLAQTLTAVQSLGLGLGSVTAVPPTRQPANTAQLLKNAPAKQTTAASKRGNESKTAQTHTDSPSTQAGSKSQTAALLTPQPASPKRKPAKKAASKTKPAAKRTPAKARAQTRTVKQSGRSGK